VHAEFERLIREVPDPPVLLKNLNRFIAHDFEGTNMYLSAFCGLVNFKQRSFSFSNYGHPPQYLYRVSSGDVLSLPAHTSFLGILFDENEYHEGHADFKPGDNFLLFTDGVLETVNKSGEFYGEVRLRDFMQKNSGISANAFNDKLVAELRDYGVNGFNDDIFILNVKTKPDNTRGTNKASPSA
jgi:sigma-B regulation protein RsbU (phosphoserine phosphatase)